ncbi:DUF2169 domain-containing protein [Celerinatantimonas sp. MCCC 1A17872]|uniref:DUF2169 domain-containing protein n=1 Tax=Celerinatantimonas sp. MCCC 1A17872 TaxID=3177514 RepID=UPI0038C98D17
MKIFKNKQYSLLPRPLRLQNTLSLSMGVLVYFDLTDSEHLLTEQALWKDIPKQLGSQLVLDQGVPKPRGEYLLTGSCFAPRNQPREASQVRVQLGELDKTISIYGTRYWKKGVITHPQPFSSVALNWSNAFGGPAFAQNPLGLGINKNVLADGSSAINLPHLEYSHQQIGAPSDRPHPASFGPIDMQWPQRAKKNGTYDAKWKAERWPYFPEDMNYEFFNLASSDQMLPGYFAGGEPYRLENVHPDLPVIEGNIPRLRMRLFVSQNPKFKLYDFPVNSLASHQLKEHEVFKEVLMHLETVWFFPTILRGVLLFRGLTDIIDEEYSDVLRVLIRHELMDEPAKSIEYYRDLQMSLLNRGVNIDSEQMDQAVQQANESMIQVRNLPKVINSIRQHALGNRPTMPPRPPEERLLNLKQILNKKRALLDSSEQMTRRLHSKFGHLVEFDLTQFATSHRTLDEFEANFEKNISHLVTKQKEAKASVNSHMNILREKLTESAKNLKKQWPKGRDLPFDPNTIIPDDIFSEPSKGPWHDRGFPLVVQWRKNLETNPNMLDSLKKLGLSTSTIKNYWLGCNCDDLVDSQELWGLDKAEQFTLPAGLIVPYFIGDQLARIRCVYKDSKWDQEMLVPGSDPISLFLPSATTVNLPGYCSALWAPILCVDNELTGILMEQLVGDCISILVLVSPEQPLSKEAKQAIEKSDVFLVVRPNGAAENSSLDMVWSKWVATFKKAQSIELPVGKSIFDAQAAGQDLRQWVMEALPKDVTSADVSEEKPAEANKLAPLKKLDLSFPFNLKEILSGVREEVKSHLVNAHGLSPEAQAKKLADIADKVKTQLGSSQKVLEKQGIDIDKTLKDMLQPSTQKTSIKNLSPNELGKQFVAKINEQLNKTEFQKNVPADKLDSLKKVAQEITTMSAQAETLQAKGRAMLDKGLAKLAEAKKRFDGNGVSPESAAEFAKAGINIDAMVPRTREEVVEMYQNGEPIAGAILANVDLSYLNLSGADFSGCDLNKTNFSSSKLDKSSFNKSKGQFASFVGASLLDCSMQDSFMQSANFTDANLSKANINKTAFNKAVFERATLDGANIRMCGFDDVNFTQISCIAAHFYLSIISGIANKADFRQASLGKCLIKKMSLEQADFRDGAIHHCKLNEVVGEHVNFAGADLAKFFTGRNCEFRYANFTKTNLYQAGLRETDFTGADFRQADLAEAILEASIFIDADFNRAKARKARFIKCNLEGAHMRAFDLMTGSLRKSRLVRTDFRGSNLYACNFYKVEVGETRFEGCNLKLSQLDGNIDLLEKE